MGVGGLGVCWGLGCVLMVGLGVGLGWHDYWGCYVFGDSRLNFLRSSYLILPATHKNDSSMTSRLINDL